MDWENAKYFLAIARDGQMLGAARRMQVSQARLSRRLAALEEAIGVRLFDRSTRGCDLTDEGRKFLVVAERMEAELVSGLAELRDSAETVSGTIRIGAPDGLGSAYLAPRLGRIAATFPQLHIQLVPLPRNFSLSEREADIAIMIGQPTKGRLRGKKLADYSLGLYAARSYLEAHGTPKRPEDLRRHRLVGYVEDLIHTPELNYSLEFLRDWQSAVEVSTAIGQLAAIRSGVGIGILHDFMTADEEGLVRLMCERRAVRAYWAIWHENLRVSARVRAVVGSLESMMKQDQMLFLPGPKTNSA